MRSKMLRSCLRQNRLSPMKSVIAATIILAHSWYPGACCHDQDCHPVPCGVRVDVFAVEQPVVAQNSNRVITLRDGTGEVAAHHDPRAEQHTSPPGDPWRLNDEAP